MYLKALEVNGFKSFAEKVRIDFTKGITSVVGPNGSGKSNILDAILWVLGEQSYKNIRAKESADVIFSGGKNKKEKSFAEVSIIIDNTDFVLQNEAQEIKVTRYINRKSDNYYFINEQKVRLKDIQEMFMDTGVGKSAYSVIGQGKVERIVGSSSVEIRSIIEEAAGIKKIKLRKNEASKRLEKVELEIEKISYVEKELYNNYKNISKQAEKALKYKEFKGESEILKKAIYKRDSDEKNIQLDEFILKHGQSEAFINELQNKFDSFEKELEEVIENREDYNNKLEDLSSKNRTLEKELELTGNNRIRVIERLKSIDKELKEKDEYIVSLNEKKKLREEKVEELNIKEEELNSFLNLEKLSNEEAIFFLSEKENRFEEIEKSLRTAKEKILDIEVERVKYLNNVEDADRKENSIEKRTNQLQKEWEEQHKELDENKKLFEEITEIKESLEIEKTVTETKLNEFIKNQKEQELLLKEALKNKDEAENLLRNKTSKFDNLKLTDDRNEGYFKGVKIVMNEELSGVFGPLLSLVEIPEEFMSAIENALGNQLQDIVVENGAIAKKAIEILKNKNGGRASFLPLDLIKPAGVMFNFRPENGVYGTANNLVKFNPAIKKAIDFVFDKVLIVENMDKAIQVQSNSNFRGTIATLKGDILSTNGRMTGGENTKSASAIIFERRRELKKLQEELNEVKKNYEKLSNEYFEINEKNSSILASIEEFRDKKELLLKNLEDKKIEYAEKNLKLNGLEKTVQILKLEFEELNENKNEYTEKRVKAIKEMDKLNERLKEIKSNNEQLELERIAEKEFLEKFRNESSNKRMLFVAKSEERKQLFITLENYAQELFGIDEDLRKIQNYIKNTKLEKINLGIKEEELLVEIEEKRKINNKDLNELEEYKFKVKDLEKDEKRLIIEVKNLETEIVKEENKLNIIREKRDKLKFLIDDLGEKIKSLNDVELVELKDDLNTAKKNLNDVEVKIQSLGYVNLLAVDEYEAAKEKYEFLTNQKNDLVLSKKNLEILIIEIEDAVKSSFLEAYKQIDENFNYMCREILNDSIGNLSLLDEKDLLESGVELMVKFKNKKYQSLSLLSGGEKSMVAVALIMAIFMYKPSPFTFFDEIEAALDESNTKRLLQKLKEFTDKSQFILITHNKHTMKESDQLYGVTMNKEVGESKILSVRL